MPDYLQTTIDKFTFRVAKDRLYTAEGMWLLPVQDQGSQRVRIGVTDFFQQHNGDVAFANVKAVGVSLHAEDELAEMETMKVTVDLPSPVAGIIVEVNKALELTPEVVNQDPYEKGWLAVIEVTDWEADRAKLLDAPAYLAVMQCTGGGGVEVMSLKKQSMVVVPCSGIGKSLGTRDPRSGLRVVRQLAPQTTRGWWRFRSWFSETRRRRERVRSSPAVTIDGCKQMCASKLVKHSGGTVARGSCSVRRIPKPQGLEAGRDCRTEPGGQATRSRPGRRNSGTPGCDRQFRNRKGGPHA